MKKIHLVTLTLALIFSLFSLSSLVPTKISAQTYSCGITTTSSCGVTLACPSGCRDQGCTIDALGQCIPVVASGGYNGVCLCGGTGGSISVQFDRLYSALQQTPGVAKFYFPVIGTSGSLTVGDILNALILYIFPIAGLLLLLYLIYGGYMFLTSAGDPGKAQMAKGVITMALTGFLIIFASYWIVQIVGQILGLQDIGSMF